MKSYKFLILSSVFSLNLQIWAKGPDAIKARPSKKTTTTEVQIGNWRHKACVFELIDVKEYGTGFWYISPEELLELSSPKSQIKLEPIEKSHVIVEKQLKTNPCSLIKSKYRIKESDISSHFNPPPFAEEREKKIKEGKLKCLIQVDPKCPPFRMPDEEEDSEIEPGPPSSDGIY